MTRKERLFQELKLIAQEKGIRVQFFPNWKKQEAFADLEKNIIEIGIGNPKLSCQSIASLFFHEVGHFECKKRGKFKIFHSTKKKMSRREKTAVLRTGLRAELYVDKIGEEIMKNYYPNWTYQKNYCTPFSRTWLKSYLRDEFS